MRVLMEMHASKLVHSSHDRVAGIAGELSCKCCTYTVPWQPAFVFRMLPSTLLVHSFHFGGGALLGLTAGSRAPALCCCAAAGYVAFKRRCMNLCSCVKTFLMHFLYVTLASPLVYVPLRSAAVHCCRL